MTAKIMQPTLDANASKQDNTDFVLWAETQSIDRAEEVAARYFSGLIQRVNNTVYGSEFTKHRIAENGE